MTRRRALSPFEISYFSTGTRLGSVPIGGMPLFIGSLVRGRIDIGVLARVLAELAGEHVLLRSRVVAGRDGGQYFEVVDGYRPPVREYAGEIEQRYRQLLNTRPQWRDGLFEAVVLRGAEATRIVLIVHHGISDGRSAFALLDEMWRRYTALIAGSALPHTDSDVALIPGVDEQLAAVVDEAAVDALLAQFRAAAAGSDAGAAPRTLPVDGDGIGDPAGRFAVRRIELDERATGALVEVARGHGISVNSLLGGAALVAVRAQFDPTAGAMALLCGHAVDLRPVLPHPVAASTMLNCAAGAGTPALVDADADPVTAGVQVHARMAEAQAMGFPALFMRAAQRELDAVTAAVFAAQPSIALSNMGALAAHSMPAGVEFVRDEISAMAGGMPPKMTIFTVGGRLHIQVEYDTAEHSHAQLGRVAEVMSAQLRRIASGVRA
ncbi:phthiocerol/phthiodiolone dimycocerosyl transferase family protein [Nocardia yamanashiensis]|uniref:phthiocerol/phthiodiolone dimycocerosyl transferase family protein n=1 Tax=Nocardia yamanashiensis TaxID=209247 RepID=UPI00082A71A5|nr:hypothetical protein [Nocardia yamanashiensis]